MDITINGKRVTLRDRIPARMGWEGIIVKVEQIQKEGDIKNIPFDDEASLLTIAVESWELDGDPAKVESYGSLDLVREFVPLANEVVEWLKVTFSTPKN